MRPLISLPARLGALFGLALLGAAATPAQAQNPYPVYCGGIGTFAAFDDSIPGPSPYPNSGCPTPDNIQDSLRNIAEDRVRHLVTNRRLSSILLGATEQINCGDCVSAFGALGSFSAGVHGRKNLTDRLSVLGGLSYNQYDSSQVRTRSAPILALGLRYDLTDWGGSRPFFEIGGSLTPGERTRTARLIDNGGVPGVGLSSAHARTWTAYGRVGWVQRLSPVAEFAAYVDLGHTSQRFGAATEATTIANPAPLSFATRDSEMTVVKLVGQHTQLLTSSVEAHLSAAVAHGFNIRSGLDAFSPLYFQTFRQGVGSATWVEIDGRLGFRLQKGIVVDVFALSTLGAKPVGATIHGGVGLRLTF